MITRTLAMGLVGVFISVPGSALGAPCASPRDLVAAVECVRENEPSYRAAAQGEEEAAALRDSAYRLINPELGFQYSDGNSLGNVEREKTLSLMFTFELGGKRGARAQVLGAEGLRARADAFEQQVQVLTDLGASVLRVHQLQTERDVLQESIGTFRKVISLYRSRDALPPEQRVSVQTFELVLLGYERKLIEVDAELLRYRTRVARLFGSESTGQPLELGGWPYDPARFEAQFDRWVDASPEMLRVQADTLEAEGASRLASAQAWPDLRIGPTASQVTEGPFDYMLYGLQVSIPIPIFSWNGAERTARAAAASRVNARAEWNRDDVRSRYRSLLSEVGRIRKLLANEPTPHDIQKKHLSTESLYRRGMVSGALVIETHRSMVEYFEAKHELQLEFLKGLLTLQHLEKSARL